MCVALSVHVVYVSVLSMCLCCGCVCCVRVSVVFVSLVCMYVFPLTSPVNASFGAGMGGPPGMGGFQGV